MRSRILWPLSLMTVVVACGVAACADVGLSPSTPASIEFDPFPAPAIAVGDSLRDINGVAAPARVTVRNQAGEILTDAPLFFTYADAARDTALAVDSLKGFIVSLRPLATTGTIARISARAGGSLQAIRNLLVTIRPDSVDRAGVTKIDTLYTTLPDTGSAGVTANVSKGVSVTVRHREGTVVSQVPNWLVKFDLIRPTGNANNDSTASVYLVNELQKASNIDTTDGSGIATRYVRVRSSKFPTGSTADSALVRVTVTYRGKSVAGSPIEITVPIIKKPTAIRQP